MVRQKKDLLWARECQPLTATQINEIKSQFHPSNTANVNIVPYEIYDEDGDEQVVGEVRRTIDGVKKKKPVYKKIIYVGDVPSSTTRNVSFTIDNLERIMFPQMYAINNSTHQVNPIPSVNTTGLQYQIEYAIQRNNNIYFRTGDSWSGFVAYLQISYTKTTDTWEEV